MRNLKIKSCIKDEKGIALLFTLGILAALLIIALGFATTSITERRAAGNNNDLSVARMLAESAVNRAVGAMRFYSEYGSGSEFDDVKSHDETTANKETFDFLWKLDTVVNGTPIYSWPYASYAPGDKGAVHWQYIDNGLPLADPNRKLIGRIAYVVVGSGGKLDPSATVSHDVAAGAASWTNPASKPSTAVDEFGVDNVDRKGAEVYELSMKNLNSAMVWFDTYIPKMNSSVIAGGQLANDTRWKDWTTMHTALALDNTSDPTGADREQLRKWFIINNPKDPEAFWVDINADGKEETSEMFHRFNLARTDWDTLDTAPNGNADGNPTNEILRDPTAYTAAATHNGTGIKWLKNDTALPAGNFPDAATRAKQIAANLIDYCDTNDEVTSDQPPANWATTAPTYTGLEKTPYINEIMGNYESTIGVTTVSGDYHITSTVSNFNVGVEIINLYGQAGTATAYISGEWTYERLRPNGTTATGPTPLTVGQFTDLAVPVTFLATDSYKFATVLAGTYTSGAAADGGTLPKINWARAKITKAYLVFNSKNADYSTLDGNWHQLNDVVVTTGVGTFSGDAWYSWQVDDPKSNLHATDWTNFTSMVAADYTSAGGTPNAINSIITCTTTGDSEAGATPTSISTNFIRNAPMQSPWELGFINRGAKWETLNIHTYNTTAGVSNTGGIGTYANGDANILDQVKMTSATQVYGKVNVQAASVDVLKALLGYVRVGVALPNNGTDGTPGNADDGNPGLRAGAGSGTLLDYNSDVTNIATAINTGTGVKPYKTRAQLARQTNLYGLTGASASGINQNTKAEKDEIIGKIINLTKAGASDTVTVIAIAQSIRDVGATAGITINKDLNQNGTVDTTDMKTD
ncbi:MAG: hypothetical protein WC637_17955, partial [Victivallales bacterium]